MFYSRTPFSFYPVQLWLGGKEGLENFSSPHHLPFCARSPDDLIYQYRLRPVSGMTTQLLTKRLQCLQTTLLQHRPMRRQHLLPPRGPGMQTSVPTSVAWMAVVAIAMLRSPIVATGVHTTLGTGLGFETSWPDMLQGVEYRVWPQIFMGSSAKWCFHNGRIDNGWGPALIVTESMIYRNLQWLKERGAPITAFSFHQDWTFLHFHAGLLGQGPDALSSRVRGAASAMYSLKRRLRHAYPLTFLMIVALENVATLAPYGHWRIIAGHRLFCPGNCSRFGDSIIIPLL